MLNPPSNCPDEENKVPQTAEEKRLFEIGKRMAQRASEDAQQDLDDEREADERAEGLLSRK